MARYPRDNQEADMWLRCIVKDFIAGRWKLDQLARASGLRKADLAVAIFSTAAITENVSVRLVKGLQYLAKCEQRKWMRSRTA